jgi:hypothetical protein
MFSKWACQPSASRGCDPLCEATGQPGRLTLGYTARKPQKKPRRNVGTSSADQARVGGNPARGGETGLKSIGGKPAD